MHFLPKQAESLTFCFNLYVDDIEVLFLKFTKT